MPDLEKQPTEMETAAWELVAELLGTGGVVAGLFNSLIEQLSEESYPGEQPDAVVLEMMVGSALPALNRVGPEKCMEAKELIQVILDRNMADLRLAAEIAGRRTQSGHQALSEDRV